MVTAKNNNAFLQKFADMNQLDEPYEKIGLWGWLGLYATGTVLLFLLFSHLWLVHYSSPQPITLEGTILALRSPFIRTVEFSLLLFAVAHGMIGLRRIVLDLEVIKKRGSRYLTWCVVAAGVMVAAWGLLIFNQLSSGIKN